VGMPLAVRRTTVHQMQHGCSERCQARCMPPAVPWEYYGDHEVLFGTAMPCPVAHRSGSRPLSAETRGCLPTPRTTFSRWRRRRWRPATATSAPDWAHPCHIWHQDWAHLPHLAPGLGSPATSGAGTGLTGATSALGLGSLLPHLHRGRLLLRHPAPKLGSPLDWTDAFHICTGTGSASAP
jgi:hypothetical protein